MISVCYLLVSTSLDFWLISLWRPQPSLVKHGPEDVFSRWANDQQYWSTKSTLYSSMSSAAVAVLKIVSYSLGFGTREYKYYRIISTLCVCIWALYALKLYPGKKWVQLQVLGLNIEKGILPMCSLYSSVPWPWTIGLIGMHGYIIWVSSMYHKMTMPRA